VVKELAGHSSIKTTQQFYLSVHSEDLERAQAIQAAALEKILNVDPTDNIVTNSCQNRGFGQSSETGD
jgi:hypothetical protein